MDRPATIEWSLGEIVSKSRDETSDLVQNFIFRNGLAAMRMRSISGVAYLAVESNQLSGLTSSDYRRTVGLNLPVDTVRRPTSQFYHFINPMV